MKLFKEDVFIIRKKYARGHSMADLATEYGISYDTVYKWCARYPMCMPKGTRAAAKTFSDIDRKVEIEMLILNTPGIASHIEHKDVLFDPKGNIYSIKYNKIRSFKKYTIAIKKYPNINLNGTTYYVHRLFAEVFIPNPQKLPIVNHINNNPCDYSVNNLVWVSHYDNIIHSVKQKRFTVNRGSLNRVFYCPELNKGFINRKQAAEFFNTTHWNITAALAGRIKKINGLYTLKFK